MSVCYILSIFAALARWAIRRYKEFKKPNADGFSIEAFRAYFHIGLENQMVPSRIVMNIGDGEASGIVSAEADSSFFTSHSSFNHWYTLDGRQLNGRPTACGIYVRNGRKMLINTK